MRALRAPNRAQRILWRISRDLNEAAPNGAVGGSPFSDEWPNPNPNPYPYRNPNPNPSPNPIDAIYSLVCLVSSPSPRPAPNSGRCLYTIAAQIAIIYINYILQCDIGNNIIQHGNVRTRTLILIVIRHQKYLILYTNTYIIIVIIILN